MLFYILISFLTSLLISYHFSSFMQASISDIAELPVFVGVFISRSNSEGCYRTGLLLIAVSILLYEYLLLVYEKSKTQICVRI